MQELNYIIATNTQNILKLVSAYVRLILYKHLKGRIMKKIWKNLCVFSMALACGVGLVGCGDENTPVSKDLDGDGVISSWETLFEKDSSTTSTLIGELTYIRSASDLLAINDRVNDGTRYKYVLANDIDLGGKEVSINLGNSSFYGNNHIISNFKLGMYTESSSEEQVDGEETETETTPSGTRCLFYGGTGIYDTRVFLGLQSITLDTNYSIDRYDIAPFVNVPYLDNIAVKGKLDIYSPKIDGRAYTELNASLLYAQSLIVDEDTGLVIPHITNIRNTEVDGNIKYFDEDDTMVTANIGGIASTLSAGSELFNGYSKIGLSATTSHEINVGALVGVNNGFITTSVSTGKMAVTFKSNTNTENVGGIAGYNGHLAEIKNTSTNVNIRFNYSDQLVTFNRYASFNYGGVVGYNAGGVLEYVQSDAVIDVDNVSKVCVGGISGRSDKGIISYAICRGSISIKNTPDIYVAQVSGFSKKGLLEKIITTTNIDVDNSEKSSTVNVGMVTIFEDVNNLTDDYSAQNSPYFKRILVDGITNVYMIKGDTFRYELGLRNQYRKIIDTESDYDDEGNEILVTKYQPKFPDIFSNLYYTVKGGLSTTGCQVNKYEKDNGEKKQNNPVITYAKDEFSQKKITVSGNTTSWIIDSLDFKNYLNHNEVNLEDNLSFDKLHFTLSKDFYEVSYFGEGSHNGELAYFDREFTQSYTHESSSTGSCEYDAVDEYMSFVYSLIARQGSATYAIKVSNDFLKVDWNSVEQSNVANFIEITRNVFTCLNTPVVITSLNENKEDIEESLSGDTDIRYVKVDFEDASNSYTILFDVENLRLDIDDEAITKDSEYSSYIVYLTFSILSKPSAN